MRVSESQIFGLVLDNLQQIRQKMVDTQNQISSQKRIVQPSDDPTTFGQIVGDKQTLATIAQRLRNIQLGGQRLSAADTVLGGAAQSLTRIKELAVQMASATNTASDRATGAQEVKQILAQLRQAANSDVGGQALFGGTAAHGRVTGLAITPPATVTSGSNDALTLSVDGTASGTVTLAAGTYATGAALASQVQTQINADTTLKAAGKSVTVTFDTDHLVIASNSSGGSSMAQVTGGTAVGLLGLNGGSMTSGALPFALRAVTSAGSGNTGGALVSQGSIRDANAVTFDDYVIKFSAANAFDVYDVSAPVSVSAAGPNTGGAGASDAGVIDSSKIKLDTYTIQFTSATQYSVIDAATSTTLSTGNTYTSGANIDFDGLRVNLNDGANGGPQSGDTFTVSLGAKKVLANQAYTSGGTIAFDGVQFSIKNGSAAPAAGDLYRVQTGVQYQGNSGLQAIEIGTNQTIQTNLSGDQVFAGSAIDLFAAVKSMANALTGNYQGGINQANADADTATNQVVAAQGRIGALSNRLDATKATLTQFQGLVTTDLSNRQDTDIVQAISQLQQQQLTLQATAQVASEMFNDSLLKFIK